MNRFFYLFFFVGILLCQSCHKPLICPDERQLAWADAEIGVLFHFDMPVFDSTYQWRNWGTHPAPEAFCPDSLDTDQWLQAALALGARYAILVAKHCSGFSLWPTEAHEYSVKNCPLKDGKGDIVADFIASCQKYDIKPGIYASTTANGYLHVDNPGLVKEGSPVNQKEYNAIVVRQLTELWSHYGPLFEIWFDGGVLTPREGGTDILSLVRKLQPDAVIFQGPYGHDHLIRWVGNEEGVAPDPCWATADSITNSDGMTVIRGLNGRPDAPFWCPGESDFTLRYNSSYQGGWFWKAGEDEKMFSVEELLHKYETSVGRNTNMLLGIVIDDRGRVPEADFKRVSELGEAIRSRYSDPVGSVSGNKPTLRIPFPEPVEIDHLILQEDISKGERVLSWHVDATLDDGTTLTICKGESIGHKRICTFPSVKVRSLRFSADSCKARPRIRDFSAFTAAAATNPASGGILPGDESSSHTYADLSGRE